MKRLVILLFCLLLLVGCANVPFNRNEKSESDNTEAATMSRFSCDAVFFGDSITCDGNFDELFPKLQIVNLGVYGDTLDDLLRRVPAVKARNPARIFLLGGINSLTGGNTSVCLSKYRALVAALREACPRAELIVQSVLPVGAELEALYDIRNEEVRAFNAGLRALAERRGLAFADLYAVYEKDGALDPALTRDGLHLNFNAYGPWAEAISPLLPCKQDRDKGREQR